MNRFNIGDKVSVKEGCKSVCRACSKLDFDYLVITGITLGGNDGYEAIKNGNKIGGCFQCYNDKHLTPYGKTIHTLQAGDIITRGSYFRKVIEVYNSVVFLSSGYDTIDDAQNAFSCTGPRTKQELLDENYTVVPTTEQTIVELPMQEIADKFNIPVESLRIKKE